MSNLESLKKVRVFVASPADMKPERECVAKVIGRLNDSTAPNLGLFLEFTDWSTAVRPDMDRPEDVILEQLPVHSWDIFIGLLWNRFGSPSGGSDPDTGAPFMSGTYEEFMLAYRSWKKWGRPRIMFYRCERPLKMSDIEAKQLLQVEDFFKAFGHDRDHPGLYQVFESTEQLD